MCSIGSKDPAQRLVAVKEEFEQEDIAAVASVVAELTALKPPEQAAGHPGVAEGDEQAAGHHGVAEGDEQAAGHPELAEGGEQVGSSDEPGRSGRSASDMLTGVVATVRVMAGRAAQVIGKPVGRPEPERVGRSEPDLAGRLGPDQSGADALASELGLGGGHVAEEASREAYMYVYAFVATCIYVT